MDFTAVSRAMREWSWGRVRERSQQPHPGSLLVRIHFIDGRAHSRKQMVLKRKNQAE